MICFSLYARPEEAQLVGVPDTKSKRLCVMTRRKHRSAKSHAEQQEFVRLIAWRGKKSVITHNAANAVPTKRLCSIMIVTMLLTVCYDRRNFDRLCSIEDDVVKRFKRLCASSTKRSVTRLNQTVYARVLTRKNFRRVNRSIPVVRYWSGASSSRFRQAKPRAE